MFKSQPVLKPAPSEAVLPALEREHQMLKRRVEELKRRAILTPAEWRESAELKKRKLAIKDSIAQMQRSIAI